jgi:hypothetical protein
VRLDYKSISKMTASQLRDHLAKYPDISGVTSMKKEKLVELLCTKLGVERHVHGHAAVDKTAIKQRIRALKKERDAAMAAKDLTKLAELRHAIHKQRHMLRRAVKLADQLAAKA